MTDCFTAFCCLIKSHSLEFDCWINYCDFSFKLVWLHSATWLLHADDCCQFLITGQNIWINEAGEGAYEQNMAWGVFHYFRRRTPEFRLSCHASPAAQTVKWIGLRCRMTKAVYHSCVPALLWCANIYVCIDRYIIYLILFTPWEENDDDYYYYYYAEVTISQQHRGFKDWTEDEVGPGQCDSIAIKDGNQPTKFTNRNFVCHNKTSSFVIGPSPYWYPRGKF